MSARGIKVLLVTAYASSCILFGCADGNTTESPRPSPPSDGVSDSPGTDKGDSARPLRTKREGDLSEQAPVASGRSQKRRVRMPGGSVIVLAPRPVQETVKAGRGCRTKTVGSRELLFPPRPGLSASRLPRDRVRVSYRFRHISRRCRPAYVEVLIDVSANAIPPDKTLGVVRGTQGTVTIPVDPDLREADVVRAIARTKSGLPSDAATVLID
jgi:hypothetical protein